MENICAGIVTFNPDLERLKDNINSIITQVDLVIIVDNGSKNISEINSLLSEMSNVLLIKNMENKGIARALNQVMLYAIDKHYNWTLLLDQDSVCPKDMLYSYKNYMDDPKLAILTPTIKDRNSNSFNYKNERTTYVNLCITSGSLTRCSVWEELNGFDENLFIDYVDNDYCIRLYNAGYKILKVNQVILLHEIGKKTTHLLASTFNHSAFRKYYMTRNTLYCAKKYSSYAKKNCKNLREVYDYNKKFDGMPSILYAYLRIIKRLLIVILYEENKKEKIKSMLKGVIDVKKMPFDDQNLNH